MLRQLVTEAHWRVLWCLTQRDGWNPQQFEVLFSHPDVEVRKALAASVHLDPERRGRLVEDGDRDVLHELIDKGLPLPLWAYERLFDRYPVLRHYVAGDPRVPLPVLHHFGLSEPDPEPDELPPLSRTEAERLVGDADEHTRAGAAADPGMPADLVERLAGDPASSVRLAVSMRRELAEQQRAAIDYQCCRTTESRWCGGHARPAIRASSAGASRRCTPDCAAASPSTPI